MKMKKIISVIAMFTLISGTVFSVNAVNSQMTNMKQPRFPTPTQI